MRSATLAAALLALGCSNDPTGLRVNVIYPENLDPDDITQFDLDVLDPGGTVDGVVSPSRDTPAPTSLYFPLSLQTPTTLAVVARVRRGDEFFFGVEVVDVEPGQVTGPVDLQVQGEALESCELGTRTCVFATEEAPIMDGVARAFQCVRLFDEDEAEPRLVQYDICRAGESCEDGECIPCGCTPGCTEDGASQVLCDEVEPGCSVPRIEPCDSGFTCEDRACVPTSCDEPCVNDCNGNQRRFCMRNDAGCLVQAEEVCTGDCDPRSGGACIVQCETSDDCSELGPCQASGECDQERGECDFVLVEDGVRGRCDEGFLCSGGACAPCDECVPGVSVCTDDGLAIRECVPDSRGCGVLPIMSDACVEGACRDGSCCTPAWDATEPTLEGLRQHAFAFGGGVARIYGVDTDVRYERVAGVEDGPLSVARGAGMVPPNAMAGVEHAGQAHIAFAGMDGTIRHFVDTGADLTETTIDGDVGPFADVALLSTTDGLFVYYRNDDEALVERRFEGGEWSRESNIDEVGGSMGFRIFDVAEVGGRRNVLTRIDMGIDVGTRAVRFERNAAGEWGSAVVAPFRPTRGALAAVRGTLYVAVGIDMEVHVDEVPADTGSSTTFDCSSGSDVALAVEGDTLLLGLIADFDGPISGSRVVVRRKTDGAAWGELETVGNTSAAPGSVEGFPQLVVSTAGPTAFASATTMSDTERFLYACPGS